MYTYNLQAMSYKGKQYGTPYYGDVYIYIYDKTARRRRGSPRSPPRWTS